MRFQNLLLVLTSASASIAATIASRQDGPVDPGIAPNCNFYDTAGPGRDTCAYFEGYWTISHERFIQWNPSLKSDCSGMKDGHSYCVDAPVPKPTTSTQTTTSTGTIPTAPSIPSPVQDGVSPLCSSWYYIKAGENCDIIVKKFGNFTMEDFIAWNPAAGADCSGLWAKTYCCIGVPGHTPPAGTTPTSPPGSTTTVAGNGIPTPTGIQQGMVDNCDAFYKVGKGETCQKIVAKFGNFTVDEFVTWNSGVGGTDCDGLWAGDYACIGVVGHSGRPPSSSTSSATKPTPTGCQVPHPNPTQDQSICNCKRWYLPAANEYCYAIEQKFSISADQFNAWNPGVGNDCESLWKGANVCVAA